jgi:hypothetical protein
MTGNNNASNIPEKLDVIHRPRGMPNVKMFFMWEEELEGLIRRYYPQISSIQSDILKHTIYMIREVGVEGAPYEHVIFKVRVKSEVTRLDEVKQAVLGLIDNGILDLVDVNCEFMTNEGTLNTINKIPCLYLQKDFLRDAVCIMDDVFYALRYVNRCIKKGDPSDRSVRGFSIDHLTDKDIKLKLEYMGFGGVISHRASKVSILRKPKPLQKIEVIDTQLENDEDFDISEVIMKYYPNVTRKQKYFLREAFYQLIACGFSVVPYSSASGVLLAHYSVLFKCQDEVDEVLQQLCEKKILNIEIRRLYQFKGISFNIFQPEIFLKFKNDFGSSAMGVIYPEG